ncbi:hypothetical protein [Thermococcus barophilus]|uniref:Uncharacterized protein n=1 Tax=Thermococcus barophilus TaxID=55802 RepID=A0A0S1X8E6_THEBA|nr:hypothetical protein [Thermococcus barophilus]ALM74061.1 hypothetical protein TBCH5v1_0082 [Thermococcus barophilus]
MWEIYELGEYEISKEELRRFHGAKALLTARGIYVVDYIHGKIELLVPTESFPELSQYIHKIHAPDISQRFILGVLEAIVSYLKKLEKDDTTAVYETQDVFVLTPEKKWFYCSLLDLDSTLVMLYAWSLDDVTKTTSAILRTLEDIELMVRKGEIEL